MKRLRFFIIGILTGCSALEGEQKSNVNDIIKTHEIRQVTKTEILVQGEKIGSQIYTVLDKVKPCDSIQLKWIIDSLSGVFNSKINLGFSISDFNSADEQALFEAYEYNQTNNIESETAIQFLDQNVLFSAPFQLTDSSCKDLTNSMGMWSVLISTKTVVNSL